MTNDNDPNFGKPDRAALRDDEARRIAERDGTDGKPIERDPSKRYEQRVRESDDS